MDKFLEYVYDKFILRDVCAYIFPGAMLFVVASALYFPSGIELFGNTSSASIFVYVFIVFFAYVAGLIIQAVGTYWCECDWWPFVRFIPPKETPPFPDTKLQEDYRLQIRSMTDDNLRGATERIVVLAMMHGNLAISFLLAALLFACKCCMSGDWSRRYVALLVFAVGAGWILLREHKKLVYRLRLWRIIAADLNSSS
jgi:hypothetical protein